MNKYIEDTAFKFVVDELRLIAQGYSSYVIQNNKKSFTTIDFELHNINYLVDCIILQIRVQYNKKGAFIIKLIQDYSVTIVEIEEYNIDNIKSSIEQVSDKIARIVNNSIDYIALNILIHKKYVNGKVKDKTRKNIRTITTTVKQFNAPNYIVVTEEINCDVNNVDKFKNKYTVCVNNNNTPIVFAHNGNLYEYLYFL